MTNELVAGQLRDAGIRDFAQEAEQILAAAPAPEILAAWLQRRIAGEPLAVILGTTRFLGATFHIAPGTLIPRPETELLARTALGLLQAQASASGRIIDMCCGVGNIGITLALRLPHVHAWLADLTEPCVRTAQLNIDAHQLAHRVAVKQGDLFEPLRGLGLEGGIDLIACNPPYISTSRLAGENAHLLLREPREAFDAGPYGMKIHQRVINEAPAFLKPGACLAFEFGAGQAKQLHMLFQRSGHYQDFTVVKNETGEDRAAWARYSPV